MAEASATSAPRTVTINTNAAVCAGPAADITQNNLRTYFFPIDSRKLRET